MRETSLDQRAVVGHQRRHDLPQHDLDDVAHVQRLARGIGQRERGRVERALVEIARRRGSALFLRSGNSLLQQPGERVEQADEDSASATLKAMWNSAVIFAMSG